ncbi:uncharacterized protein LOC142571110 [Dermacentor variabilis]|uniref:uncharacterized protein LOC142571110 n=1 Tax=Dermacentor variabilis TaxID=34621 RepID=UPI003F5B0A92
MRTWEQWAERASSSQGASAAASDAGWELLGPSSLFSQLDEPELELRGRAAQQGLPGVSTTYFVRSPGRVRTFPYYVVEGPSRPTKITSIAPGLGEHVVRHNRVPEQLRRHLSTGITRNVVEF